MQKFEKLTILDCTLRDGGYYNNWDFDPVLVESYLASVAAAGVQVVEIGLRFTPKDKFLGPFAYSTDEMISSLPLPANITIGVMINASDILGFDGTQEAAIDSLFNVASGSPVDIVRIAAHFKEADQCGPMVSRLKALGYEIGFNLMQSAGREDEELTRLAKVVTGWGDVDILYFADSLGNMSQQEVRRIVAALKLGWDGEFGIHTHDNMGEALGNCRAAMEAGVTWLDGTIQGMGRGAGNVATENLLLEITQSGKGNFQPDALFRLAVDEFGPLRDRYCWGSNLFYRLSGHYGVHPTYVQQMLGHDRYATEEIVAAIKTLGQSGGQSFSGISLRNAVAERYCDARGRWSANGFFEGETVLLMANTPESNRHRNGLIRFIARRKPIVISLNYSDLIPADLISAYACCHPTRLVTLPDDFANLGKPLIAPMAAISETQKSKLAGIEVLDYGMAVKDATMEVSGTGCTVPDPLVAAYSLCLMAAGGAKHVLLAGFDGYSADDPRHHEMVQVFELLAKIAPDLELTAILPTSYALHQTSIYSPDI